MHINEVDGLMGAKVQIEHNGAAWIEIFKSEAMQAVVDEAGERIAAAAGEHFSYARATDNKFTVAGFVDGDEEGSILEATDKVLTKAINT